jgi:hypothetical protein
MLELDKVPLRFDRVGNRIRNHPESVLPNVSSSGFYNVKSLASPVTLVH